MDVDVADERYLVEDARQAVHELNHGGIDVFAAACVIFAVTGLGLMFLHAKGRPSTWPLAALGLLIPVVIALIFIH